MCHLLAVGQCKSRQGESLRKRRFVVAGRVPPRPRPGVEVHGHRVVQLLFQVIRVRDGPRGRPLQHHLEKNHPLARAQTEGFVSRANGPLGHAWPPQGSANWPTRAAPTTFNLALLLAPYHATGARRICDELDTLSKRTLIRSSE